MPWNSDETPTPRGTLARHLAQLQQSLSAVAEQVRAAVSKAVGRTVAEAVGEAVYEALESTDGHSRPLLHSPMGYSGRSQATRREWDDPWGEDAERPDWPDPDSSDGYGDRLYDEPEPESTLPGNDKPDTGCWGQAVAAGLQAAAWWLLRGGWLAWPSALVVGVTVVLATFVGQAAGATELVASGLGLVLLAGLVRLAATLLGSSPAT